MNKVIEIGRINNKKYEVIFLNEDHYEKVLELNHHIMSDSRTQLFITTIQKNMLSRCLSNGSSFGLGTFVENKMVAYRLVLCPNQCSDLYLDYQNPDLDMSLSIPKVQLKYLARLTGIAVHPLYRNNRLASTMTKIALSLLKRNNFLYAIASCHPKNNYSLKHLTKLGFKICSPKKREHGNHKLILFNNSF